MDIDASSHSPTLCNKILQELNLNGLCQYNNLHKAYIFKKSTHIVNCSYMFIFLRQSTCCVIMPHAHQWYKINANEILENHKLVLCDDQMTHMVLGPPAELPEINAITTTERLKCFKAKYKQVSNTHKLRTHNLLMIGYSKSIKWEHSLIKTLINGYLQNLKDHLVKWLAHFHPLWDGAKLNNTSIIILVQ